MLLPGIIFIVGPTAVGKSDVAIVLAQRIQGEIISCDSMQVYREIHIASNKPSGDELKSVPHHLIDIISVRDEFDVARFNQLALTHIKAIHSRQRVPIVVGGSGMYVQILLDGIFEGRGKDPELRQALVRQAHELGPDVLYEKLKRMDPQAAARTHPNDLKRIIRALEIVLTENKSVSELHKERKGLWGQYPIDIFGLNLDRKELYKKIEARVDHMFQVGAVEEVRALQNMSLSKTAECIIGVKEIRGYLNGAYAEGEARDLMKLHTRRLAKRQLTWFRKDKRVFWLMLDSPETPRRVAERILEQLQIREG
ncbi:MAG TPA: tRNA (adenosine(37)-N6)-dimethylallyltransferase MiaA [Candidatus Omnitrophica bacterium]|nr:MAG: tRNA (adenosine(37)-N6)-dimethylallyltransferase MiaA [Omnitrophica WOR_2 bacterium GWA2_45_18]HBR14449.1 tRNA (adenosine(37)-N6)-dimethylallyltransferase MiaA [Candidatus Omnitrophota bacterium]